MRETHQEQIERWANFIKTNPNWRKYHNQFINSLFKNNHEFIQRMLKTPKGKEKLIELYQIKNKNGYSWLK